MWTAAGQSSPIVSEINRKKMSLLLLNLYVPFSINGAFTDVQVTHAMGTKTPIPSQMLSFGLCSDNSLDGPFLLSLEDSTSMMSTK